jgi:predicted RNase H-like nuclease
VVSDDEIVTFVERHRGHGVVVAFDAPLVVPNQTGRRDCEAGLSRDFARYHAGTHPSNRSRPWFVPEPRGARLAARLGLDLDPAVRPCAGTDTAIEVYPHPAMVSLFGLERVIRYKAKRGRDLESLRAAFETLFGHLETTLGPVLRLDESERWSNLRDMVADATRKSQLRLVEDEVDAIFCAYLALLWAREPERMVVYGDVTKGFIVTPQPPPAGPSLSA